MYIDINTLFTFEVSKSDDQSILAAIVPVFKKIRTLMLAFVSVNVTWNLNCQIINVKHKRMTCESTEYVSRHFILNARYILLLQQRKSSVTKYLINA
jgi:hypothetical protein